MVKYLNPGNQNPRRITKADKEFAKKLNFKNTKSPAKSREIHKIEKKNSISIVFLAMQIRKDIQFIYVSKKCCVVKKNMLTYYWYQKKEKDTMFLSKILILLCMIIIYIVGENIVVNIVYKLLVQKKY